MDFQSADYGISITGMNTYIDDLNTKILTDVARVIRNTKEVETAVKGGWVGNSADQFLLNLNKGAEKMIETLAELKNTFETELKGIQSQMLEMDENLVEEE